MRTLILVLGLLVLGGCYEGQRMEPEPGMVTRFAASAQCDEEARSVNTFGGARHDVYHCRRVAFGLTFDVVEYRFGRKWTDRMLVEESEP